MIEASTFARLFETWYPRLYAYIRSKVTSRDIAEDLTATAFERAFRHGHTYDPKKGDFDAWLFRIGRNLVINHYRDENRKPAASYELTEMEQFAAPHTSPEQQLLQQELHRRLRDVIQELTERDQEIIRLRFFGQLTNRRIAEILELNEKTVSVIIYRALKKLKAGLKAGELS